MRWSVSQHPPSSRSLLTTWQGVLIIRNPDYLGSVYVRSDVSGASVSWRIVAYAVVVWGCRTFDSLLPIFPPFPSFCAFPLSRAFWPADAQMSTGSLPVLPFCVFSVQQFPVASLVSIHISPSIPIWESTVCYNKNSTAQRGPGGKVGLFRNHVKYQ